MMPSAFALCVGLLCISCGSTHAKTIQLICENPRREYVVSFSEGDANLKVAAEEGFTLYRVLAVENSNARYVLVALTPDSGPTVRLSLRPYMKMEYWSGSELLQTDACRAP